MFAVEDVFIANIWNPLEITLENYHKKNLKSHYKSLYVYFLLYIAPASKGIKKFNLWLQ